MFSSLELFKLWLVHCSNAVLPSSCCLFKTLCFLLSHPRVAFFGPTTTIAQRSESHNWQICTTVRTIFRCISYPSTTYKICREYFQLDVVLKNYYSKYCCTIQLRLYFVYNTIVLPNLTFATKGHQGN